MTKLKLIDLMGKTIGDVEVPAELVVEKPHKQAMFQTVVTEQASWRQGTHGTLTKGEVRGGGRKPFAQKHTGNARQGSIRNPHYVGGGVVFGPKPNHNYAIGTNAKIVKLAVKSAFSLKLKTNAIYVLDDKANTNKPSTKVIANLLKSLKVLQQKTLFIFNNENAEKLIKSAKNIYRVVSKKAHQVSARDLMHANLLVIQASALKSLVKVVS